MAKKISKLSWKEVTKPFRQAKIRMSEDEVVELIHKIRKELRKESLRKVPEQMKKWSE